MKKKKKTDVEKCMSSFPLPPLARKDEAGQLKKHAAKRDCFTLFTWYNDKQ